MKHVSAGSRTRNVTNIADGPSWAAYLLQRYPAVRIPADACTVTHTHIAAIVLYGRVSDMCHRLLVTHRMGLWIHESSGVGTDGRRQEVLDWSLTTDRMVVQCRPLYHRPLLVVIRCNPHPLILSSFPLGSSSTL